MISDSPDHYYSRPSAIAFGQFFLEESETTAALAAAAEVMFSSTVDSFDSPPGTADRAAGTPWLRLPGDRPGCVPAQDHVSRG